MFLDPTQLFVLGFRKHDFSLVSFGVALVVGEKY
jgi:hypothetical protein